MPVPSPANIRIRLFGVPSIESDGDEVSLARRTFCFVLLAMIVMQGPDRHISRALVAETLWPHDDELTAATNLRRFLSFLINAFPDAGRFIGRSRESLWCRATDAPWCDVVEFERGAVELYVADFMEGHSHEWVVAQRDRLRCEALEKSLHDARNWRVQEDDDRALESIQRALRIDPCNEAAAQLEMELHGERGDIDALDRSFVRLQRNLGEIDLTPARETVALRERFHAFAREAAARIPRPLTSFVETGDLSNVIELAGAHRLVTIVGPGGVGKTRLALEAAYRLASGFPDGAYFADLSTIVEGDALANAIARVLGAPAHLASNGFSGIYTMLRNRRALLVLDNCEQIVESCSWFVNELLKEAPHVRVIATTRQSFDLRVEHCYALEPLPMEQAERLFMERAHSAAWKAGDGPTAGGRVASICKRLDCLPLALELAASMLGVLSLSDVEQQLADGFERLRSRDRTAPVRHRSLDDVIAWSVSLLDERARDAFTKLGVFAGSFSADAALAVCGVDVSDLAKLVATSVLSRADAIESRYGFLNVIAEGAMRKLDGDPRSTELRDAHAAWCVTLAMRSEDPAFWPNERAWLEEIAREFANLSRAFEWTLYEGGRREDGVRLAIGLTQYFLQRGFPTECAAWLRAALAVAEPGSIGHARLTIRLARTEVIRRRYDLGNSLARQARSFFEESGLEEELADAAVFEAATLLLLGRLDESKGMLEQTLPLAIRVGRQRTLNRLYSNLAVIASVTDPARSRELELEALRCVTEIGDRHQIAFALNRIAAFDYLAGNYDVAIDGLERALATFREFGNTAAVAGVVTDLGDVGLISGRLADAHRHYAEALSIVAVSGEIPAYPYLFSGVAGLAIGQGRPREAARLLGAARWRDSTVGAARLRVREHVLSLAEGSLGRSELAREMALGKALPEREALQLARSIVSARPAG